MAPYLLRYVRERNVRSCDYDGQVVSGTSLPSDGVSYDDVPDKYRVRLGYRYTVINDRPILIDYGYRVVKMLN